MNNDSRTQAQDALFRTIAEKRKTDPLIGAKLGAAEVFARLTRAMKTDKGVHVESLLCALAALAGYACQVSARATAGRLIAVDGADGKRYYFGDAMNKPLVEDNYSVWSISAGAAQLLGPKTLPNVSDIVQHVSKTVGGPEFGKPRASAGHLPGDLPVTFLKTLWPKFLPLLKMYCEGPSEWPILFALSIQQAITLGKDIIDPSEALRLVMECAIPMSKVDLDSLRERDTPATSNKPNSAQQNVKEIVLPSAIKAKASPKPTKASVAQDEIDDDLSERLNKKSLRVVAIILGIVSLPILYYAIAVFNFVPSKQWDGISVGVGFVLSLLFIVILALRMFGSDVFSQFSVGRVVLALVAGLGIFWWLFYLGCNYIVGDVIARTMGKPTTAPALVYNSNARRRWSCSPRLISDSVGRGKCISWEQHKSLPRTVSVVVESRNMWMGNAITGITIDSVQQDEAARILASLIGDRKEKPVAPAAPPNQQCPFLKQKLLATSPPEMPANGDRYRLEARNKFVAEAKTAPLLQDAVFAIHYFNSVVNAYASDPQTPDIEPIEIFDSVDEASYKANLCRASAVLTQTAYVGAAYQGYKNASSPEDAMQRMRAEHPGFSDANYNLVRDKSMTAMR